MRLIASESKMKIRHSTQQAPNTSKPNTPNRADSLAAGTSTCQQTCMLFIGSSTQGAPWGMREWGGAVVILFLIPYQAPNNVLGVGLRV